MATIIIRLFPLALTLLLTGQIATATRSNCLEKFKPSLDLATRKEQMDRLSLSIDQQHIKQSFNLFRRIAREQLNSDLGLSGLSESDKKELKYNLLRLKPHLTELTESEMLEILYFFLVFSILPEDSFRDEWVAQAFLKNMQLTGEDFQIYRENFLRPL